MNYFLLYLLLINAAAFVLMLADKVKARKNRWRIPERTLIGSALLGGSIGALLLFMVYVRACLWLYLFPFVLIRPAPTRPPSARAAYPHPKRTAASERFLRTDPRRP